MGGFLAFGSPIHIANVIGYVSDTNDAILYNMRDPGKAMFSHRLTCPAL